MSSILTDNERYQREYARTVLAHMILFCVEKGSTECSLADLVKEFDASSSNTTLCLDLSENRRLDGQISFRYYRYGGSTPTLARGRLCHGDSPFCAAGMPFFNTPEHVQSTMKNITGGNTRFAYPKFFSHVVNDPAAFLDWCRGKLAESAGKAGKRACTRFPKDSSLNGKTYVDGRSVSVSYFNRNLADSYLLYWWEELVAARYAASALPLMKENQFIVSLTGPISDPVKQNRKASAADVADYINKLVAAVRRAPVACGLLASGRRPDDPLVLMFVDQPRSLARATGEFDSSRYDSGWMDPFLGLLTNSILNPNRDGKDFDEKDGVGMPMAQLLGTVLDLAKEQAALARAGGQFELLPTKELVSRMHDAVTDPGTELAMEMSLVYASDDGTYSVLRDLGRVALAMHGHEEFEAIRKTAMNRIKSTNDSYFK